MPSASFGTYISAAAEALHVAQPSLSRTGSLLSQEHPDIRFHITSGDTQDLVDELNNGLIDFAVIYTDVDHSRYQTINLPTENSFGLLMPKNSELAKKDVIRWSDLKGLPILISRASEPYFSSSGRLSGLNIIATYNLIYNASLMVEDGILCVSISSSTQQGTVLLLSDLSHRH